MSKFLNRGFMLIFASLLLIPGLAKAQCVQCTPNPSGWVCTSAQSQPGGSGCRTPDLFTCTLIGICMPGSDFSSEDCQLKPVKGTFVSVDDLIIREIGLRDARLALALMSIRSIGFEFSEAKTSFFSVEYNSLDVENQLKSVREPSYSSNLKRRVEYARLKDPSIIEYRSVIADSLSGPSLEVFPVDFAGSSLSMKLERGSSLRGVSAGYRVSSYEIK